MSYAVNWTTKAKSSFQKNLDYLAEEWTVKVLNDFIDRVDEILSRIEENPLLYPVYDRHRNIHKCVVHKRIALYYRVFDNNNVDLIVFWNTYQDPKKLKF